MEYVIKNLTNGDIMKKAKKLTVLFLTGSLALCAMPTHTNAGLFSDFFSRKYLKYHVALTASTLFIAATLTDFYVENEKVETGKLLEAPFYLRQLGDIATGKVLEIVRR